MKFLFDDGSFSFEALRAAGYAVYSGADLGEVLVTCREIPEGDEEAWSARWAATAARIERIGRDALAAGHRVSAREALLRASNYYRTADFYRREDPAADAESARLAKASRQTFADAAALLDPPARAVRIPYEGTTLPGYLFLADDSGAPRPTVIFHGGYDSTLEEDYFALAAGALRRGYHVLAFDGPGQGSTVREQGLHFRPDWEAVVTPVVDFALTLPEVDPGRLALVGMSLGGYLAARAAAFEHRLAACVLHDGVYDVHEVMAAVAGRAAGGAQDTEARWLVRNGRWTFGVSGLDELVKASRAYTVAGIVDRITCPTLVLDAENDQFFAGQPRRVFDELTCPKELVVFREAEGGGEHCHEGAMLLFHQRTFDWLDTVL
ncbi:pimeloyl-ACP methyl ester carboxylesterase [Amycolatopsis bartoniae]|uniref:Dipeptidyl aminopeptidase n=1 Tax=Amycolatopsis bartoniae TaxID=941986 RepID=A0A8H9ME84_9PSEU|nr:alpha/beta fold hydrolase [Amycolatopsis bartoniae]MBB2938544.1 pimeloyl-ACP methyl ester carboxylesterase [Amycolatopsis bartoniae]TVT10316.1 alpha/beta fold hydrolase [Amycolatopsis bartoniae]GHF70250.1 dipeptidyl aminopeptidase [Amycolatopsis bartoniae]